MKGQRRIATQELGEDIVHKNRINLIEKCTVYLAAIQNIYVIDYITYVVLLSAPFPESKTQSAFRSAFEKLIRYGMHIWFKHTLLTYLFLILYNLRQRAFVTVKLHKGF